jgi:hypothetical protein
MREEEKEREERGEIQLYLLQFIISKSRVLISPSTDRLMKDERTVHNRHSNKFKHKIKTSSLL